VVGKLIYIYQQTIKILNSTASILKADLIEKMNALIVDAIQDIKGKNIVLMDLRHLGDAPTDFFVVCEGDSTTQVKAIASNIHKRIKEELGFNPAHTEGIQSAQWVLVDYFNTVVHIFHPETRAFYEIEDLWSDAKVIEYQNI